MARIMKKSNDLEKKYKLTKFATILCFLVSLGCFLTFAIRESNDFSTPLLLGFAGGAALGGVIKQKCGIYRSGLDGEKVTAGIVSSLPDHYCSFQNLKITYDGKTSELDMVVVGLGGVFIIETKNLGGSIVGNYDSPQWSQTKISQQGVPYSKSFQNPVKQVGTHVYRLANYLKSNGIDVHIKSMVYFANPTADLQLNGTLPTTPVFDAVSFSESDIHSYITANEKRLSTDQIVKIVTLLKQ